MGTRDRVHYYQTADGSLPFFEWLQALNDPIGRHRIRARLKLLEFGHLGDWKAIGDSVMELRIHSGPGYRIYLGQTGTDMTIILWAGSKRTQARDIARAQHYWADYQRRTQ